MVAARAVNVLVYAGTGTTAESVRHCLASLRRALYPNYAVIPMEEQTLLREPWAATCALLVVPGGADLGYCRVLDGRGNRLIGQYVRAGGRYLGFCAGGYYGSRRCEFEVGNRDLEVVGPRELAFFPGTCRGAALAGFAYHSERGARAARLLLDRAALAPPQPSPAGAPPTATRCHCYFNGGGLFVDAASMTAAGVEVLATYADDLDVGDGDGGTKPAAIVYCKIGRGAAVLTGPHPEFDPANLLPHPDVPGYADVVKTLKADDESRRQLLRAVLAKLGLDVVGGGGPPSPPPLSAALHLAALYPDETEELAHALGDVVSREGNDAYIRAEHDVFQLMHTYDGPETAAADDKAADAPVKQLVLYETRHPARSEVPSFDFAEYFASVQHYRRTTDGDAVDWGNLLMYGKVVTSTNTLLEKNPKLLSKLPTGFTFTARTQLAGRGRGSNVWVAPPGQLIMSTVINHPHALALSRPMVFIQYLAGVAIVEAIHSYGEGGGYDKLGIKLKWPNDVYALDPANPHLPPVKIGGILSNCSFSDGHYQVVLGIGLNATNERPTTSLNALLRDAHAAAPPDPYVIERLLARIVTRLETLYRVFCRDGFQGDLERRYYRHWLHDGQVVTLESEAGSPRARVTGITMDWGLLRVEELAQPCDRPTGRFWKLQSDENSFDFWKGLVRSKT